MPDELDLNIEGETASPATPPVEELTLGSQFLSNIPEQDRPIVQKYVKDWDGNVTKKMQALHEQYKPYKELGADVEELKRAYAFTNNFRQNGPQMFGTMLKGFFEHYGDNAYQELNRLLGIEAAAMSQDQEQWQYTEEPDEDTIFRTQVQQELEELREFKQQYQQQQEHEAASRQFDQILQSVSQSRPDVPQQFIIQGFAAGETNIQNILSSWDSYKEQFGGQQTSRPNPPVTGGQGGVPAQGQVDVSKLDKSGRMSLVEQMLAASQDQ